MKKTDIYLAGAILIIALVWFLINIKLLSPGNKLCVYIDNMPVGTYGLDEACEQAVYNDAGAEILKFTIDNGTVDVVNSECPDKLCVHQKPVSKAGETIVCLPQKIVLMIEGEDTGDGKDDQMDAVVY